MKNAMKCIVCMIPLAFLGACAGISDSASSGSSVADAVTPDMGLNNFIQQRYDAIRRDAAVGGGENIDALADLIGQRDRQGLALWMQENYGRLFSGQQAAAVLLKRIEEYRQQGRS